MWNNLPTWSLQCIILTIIQTPWPVVIIKYMKEWKFKSQSFSNLPLYLSISCFQVSIIIIPSSYLFYLLTYILQFNSTINSDLLPTVPILIFSHSNVYFVSLIITSSPLSYNTEEKGKNTMRSDRLQFKTIYPYILVVNDLRNWCATQ